MNFQSLNQFKSILENGKGNKNQTHGKRAETSLAVQRAQGSGLPEPGQHSARELPCVARLILADLRGR
jgi:hypothetical protein